MRMSDIIKLNDKNFTGIKKFPYVNPADGLKKETGLEMKKITAAEPHFSDEGKDIENIYDKHMTELRSIFDRTKVDFHILPHKNTLQGLSKELVDRLSLCNIDIIKIFMRYEEGEYLCSHSVNVTFLSVMLGVWLNYNKSELNKLAIAAMLHDIGMVRVLKLAMVARKLTPAERREIEKHPSYSREFTASIPDIDAKIVDAVYNHHNRLSASGEANEYSQIIGLIDIFEAMTHPRAYRKAQEPYSVIRKIIEELKGCFDSRIIKALIDNIGIYPVGTWVSLDTEEIGLVIDVNPGLPLSPKVNILFNKEKNKLAEPRTVDLSKQKNIHIQRPLDEDTQQQLQERLFAK